MARVSILLPCRDAAAHLPDCIASLAAQTFRDFEVVAVDDASSDETPVLLEEWRERDARVRVLRTGPDHGVVAALAQALAGAGGELVARMDADDVAHPRRLERQLWLLEGGGLDACGCRVRYFPRDAVRNGARRYERWINSLVEHDDIARDLFVECPIPHPTLFARRAALEAVGGYRDAGWPEDYDLILRLCAEGFRFGKTREVLLRWRERPDRLSRTDPRYDEHAFRRCKVSHLRATRLRDEDEVVICGAGPVGKAFSRALRDVGVSTRAFVELDPRKIGQRIHHAPVVPYAELPHVRGDAFVLAAVAGDRPRRTIRRTLTDLGLVELRDFLAVA